MFGKDRGLASKDGGLGTQGPSVGFRGWTRRKSSPRASHGYQGRHTHPDRQARPRQAPELRFQTHHVRRDVPARHDVPGPLPAGAASALSTGTFACSPKPAFPLTTTAAPATTTCPTPAGSFRWLLSSPARPSASPRRGPPHHPQQARRLRAAYTVCLDAGRRLDAGRPW